MHAVGDVAERILRGWHFRPVVSAQLCGHAAMYAADAIDAARAIERQPRHVEAAADTRRAAEREQLLHRHVHGMCDVAEMLDEEAVGKGIVAGGHRCMSREHALRGHGLEPRLEGQSMRHLLAQQLDGQEGGMTLVHVPHRGRQAQRTQRANAADAEHDFLAQPVRLVAAVKPEGDIPVLRRVSLDVGIEQVGADVAHLRPPQPCLDLTPGHGYAHADRLARPVLDAFHGQVARVDVAVTGQLHAVRVHGLGKVALPVEKADGDEVQLLVTGCLAVIPGEDAKATGIDRETLVQSVFGAEIGHQRLTAFPGVLGLVAVEVRQHIAIALQVGLIGRCLVQYLLADTAEHQSRVGAGLAPQRLVQVLEQRAGGTVPAVGKIGGQFRQALEGLRDER